MNFVSDELGRPGKLGPHSRARGPLSAPARARHWQAGPRGQRPETGEAETRELRRARARRRRARSANRTPPRVLRHPVRRLVLVERMGMGWKRLVTASGGRWCPVAAHRRRWGYTVRSRLGTSFTEARRIHFARKGGWRETRSTPTTVRSHGGLRRPLGGGEESNAAHLESNCWLRWVREMEGGEAEGVARSGGLRCGGERARARRRGAAMAAQFSLCRSRMREGEELGQLWCGVATL
jgi:hypothetical protein